jgi:hypothetical protein
MLFNEAGEPGKQKGRKAKTAGLTATTKSGLPLKAAATKTSISREG